MPFYLWQVPFPANLFLYMKMMFLSLIFSLASVMTETKKKSLSLNMCLDHCLEHVEKLLLQHPVSRNLCIHIRYPLDTRKYVYQVYL